MAPALRSRDEMIGRGHSERLVPMLDEMLDGRRADRILVGVGPGSFTGIRVGIAAAQGLAIGWNCELQGMSSLALARGRRQKRTASRRRHSTAAMASCSSSSSTAALSKPPSEPVQPSAVRGRRLHRRRAGRWAGRERACRSARPGPGRRRLAVSAQNALRLPEELRTLAAEAGLRARAGRAGEECGMNATAASSAELQLAQRRFE